MSPKYPHETVLIFIFLSVATALYSSSSFSRDHNSRQLLKSGLHSHQRSLGHTRTLTASSWRPIRIKLEFSTVVDKTSQMATFILDVILSEVKNQLSQMLQVKGNTKIPMFSFLNCLQQNEIPAEYKTADTDADLVLFVKLQEFEESFLAYATNCLLSGDDYRPLVGMVMINTKFIPMTYSAIEPLKKAFLHEIMHVLAFDRFLYKKYPAFQNSGIGVMETAPNAYSATATDFVDTDKKSVVITAPAIEEFGKKHFNCNSFFGLFMENEGGNAAEQSHLDQRYFGNEIMTPELNGYGVLSGFSLSLLSSISWYQVNFAFEEVLEWGKGAGCEFLQSPNEQFLEFCTGETKSCSRMRMRRTKCQASKFANGYQVAISSDFDTCNNNFSFQLKYPFEANGANSRCLDIEVSGAKAGGCYRTDCSDPSKLKLTIDGKEFVCNSDGQRITYQTIVVICPPRSEICRFSCPKDCSGNGVCLANNTCQCYHFFSGPDCSVRRECNSQESPICSKIQPPAIKVGVTDYASILRNVAKIIDANGSNTSLDKILKGNNLDFKPMTSSQQISIIATTGQQATGTAPKTTLEPSTNPAVNNQIDSDASLATKKHAARLTFVAFLVCLTQLI